MFDRVLNTPLPLDSYLNNNYNLRNLYVHIVVPECLKDVVSRLRYS